MQMKYKKLIDHKTLRQALLYYGRRCQNGIVQRLEENDEIRDAVKQIRKHYSCFKDAEAARIYAVSDHRCFFSRYSREIESTYEA